MTCKTSTFTTIGASGSSIPDKIKISPQYTAGKFKGEKKVLDMTLKDGIVSSWRFLFEKNHQIPDRPLPIHLVDLSYFNTKKTDELNYTWLGHSSLMININGYRILTDPVFEEKVSIVGPSRFNGELPLDPEQLSDIDIVIISHDHYDHLNKFSIQLLAPVTQKFVVPLAVGKKLVSWGVPKDKIIELDWWETYSPDTDIKVTATPAQHFSGRGILDRNSTLWASWVVSTPGFRIFFSGDSGYFKGFKEIGEKFGPFDINFIECGAYNEQWKKAHMFPEETVQAHVDLKGKLLQPIHWGTFNLALHPWYEPMQRAKKAADSNKILMATPMAGQSIVHGANNLGSLWWEKF